MLRGHDNHPHTAQAQLRAEETVLTCVGLEGRTQCNFRETDFGST